MNEFLIGLQFLTRLSVVRQTVWTEESFGKSVKYFPAVGAVLGICYALPLFVLVEFSGGELPIFTGALSFFLTVVLTGGIHCDGLMDSADGLFSGRERARMLEIMKDSCAGAFGVVSLVTAAALEISAAAELVRISPQKFLVAVYVAPIVGRLAMVLAIANFPYARPEGLGKAFAKYATLQTFLAAAAETILLLVPLNFLSMEIFSVAVVAVLLAMIFALNVGRYVTAKLGGLTGDIYGAVEMLTEILVLIIFLFAGLYFQ